ncbi:Uncharacterised protein [Vibrio cholerae]|nr:Uncharacterised protein [Vibrio cholerae]
MMNKFWKLTLPLGSQQKRLAVKKENELGC